MQKSDLESMNNGMAPLRSRHFFRTSSCDDAPRSVQLGGGGEEGEVVPAMQRASRNPPKRGGERREEKEGRRKKKKKKKVYPAMSSSSRDTPGGGRKREKGKTRRSQLCALHPGTRQREGGGCSRGA